MKLKIIKLGLSLLFCRLGAIEAQTQACLQCWDACEGTACAIWNGCSFDACSNACVTCQEKCWNSCSQYRGACTGPFWNPHNCLGLDTENRRFVRKRKV
ncbi:hypothetical protein Bealeia1_01878 [Candidatus Bealeia paramacronuclearis]|uniref:4Fe-4S ferredoxin-type domain-containing protein n=1 Tax=Candidatus Bealeia paramacronuclearis TaxID=1921001 RepID=A0ABZ2C5B0_9PROT|nr:hypothetical protein [Candidatus Bealeia paramacronuclearis]